MRILTQEELKGKSKQELNKMLLMLETDLEITPDHERNMDEIKLALNGGLKFSNKDALDLIKACEPDISDMGNN